MLKISVFNHYLLSKYVKYTLSLCHLMPLKIYYLVNYDCHKGSKNNFSERGTYCNGSKKSNFLVSKWTIWARGRARGGMASGDHLFLIIPETYERIRQGGPRNKSYSKDFFCTKWVLFDGTLTPSGDGEIVQGTEHTLLLPVGYPSMTTFTKE